MTLAFYADEHIKRAIVGGLRLRGIDILTVQEDGYRAIPDPMILDRAAELNRLVFTNDDDFLMETTIRVSHKTRNILRELTQASGLAMQQIVVQAIEQYQRQYFLDIANRAYAELRADKNERQQMLSEREAWDTTLLDDLDE